jgi:hypothetical protein
MANYGKQAGRDFFQALRAGLPQGDDLLTELMDAIQLLSTKAGPLQDRRQKAALAHLETAEGKAAVKAHEDALAADAAP